MKILNLKNEDNAVVGIITVVLIIGLLVSVLSVVKVTYVPQWVEEEEAKHMELVSTQFGQLKSMLDFQSLIDRNTGFTSYVTLGRNEIPFFEPYRGLATLRILSNQTTMKIEENNSNTYSFTSGGIQFSSKHSSFVDQTYIIEAGAFIMAQSGANGVKGNPQIVIPSYNGNISIIFVNISGVSGRNHIAGLGTYPVLTETIDITDYNPYEHATNLTVFTNYPRAWYHVFNNSFRNKLTAYEPGLKGYEIIEHADKVQIRFYDPADEYYTISVREVKISVQIAWGLL